ncbi:MAG: hypothetical protein IH595_10545 [Bacteroidales bacterium]|nr:hypothetical protein [Bacteroidales bacterium]
MKKMIFIAGLLLTSVIVFAKNKQDTVKYTKPGNPKIQYNVHKVYDKNGNLIRYDSTYSWSYHHNSQGRQIDVDSVFRKFMPYFRQNFPNSDVQSMQNHFMDMPDSAMILDFFNNKDFFNQWQGQLFDFQQQIREMDSLRNRFLKQYMQKQRKSQNKIPNAGIY